MWGAFEWADLFLITTNGVVTGGGRLVVRLVSKALAPAGARWVRCPGATLMGEELKRCLKKDIGL